MTLANLMKILSQYGLNEINNKKSKNFLCGCLYRHPNTDTAKFMEYTESTLTKVDKNKYAVFFMGDFNIDLLKYESHNYTNDFINSLVSHSSLPYILQPTRVTDHSSTTMTTFFQILRIMKLPVVILPL